MYKAINNHQHPTQLCSPQGVAGQISHRNAERTDEPAQPQHVTSPQSHDLIPGGTWAQSRPRNVNTVTLG